VIRRILRYRVLWLVAIAHVVSSGSAVSAHEQETVVLRPGQNIQAIVERSLEGTRFVFEPGTYRHQAIYPKNRQEFIGQEGVILSGAIELTTWSSKQGVWTADGLPRPLPFHGECEDGGDLCKFQEDLFVNGRLFERAGSLDELGPGSWYFENGRAYLTDDPVEQLVELGITPLAFGGDAEDVVLRDLIIEKYASDAQEGAIHIPEARGWRLYDVIARWNHGVGLEIGPATSVQRGSSSYNGQLGIGGTGQDIRIEGTEIAFNNYAGYDAGWEAGGTKFAKTTGLVVLNSCVHHNNGPGLWTDIDNIDVLYDGNKVFLNAREGIKHEISFDAIIRNNTVARNGTSRFDGWLWGSQILIQDSSNADIYGNIVEISAKFGNGIGVIYQDRGAGAHGRWDATNNLIHDNTVIHLGNRGLNGIVTDTGSDWFWNVAINRFNSNKYIMVEPRGEYWTANGQDLAWNDFKELGFERSGEVFIEQRAPMAPSCK
jgi:hypothetical protein